jgi:chemotaxis protein CheX
VDSALNHEMQAITRFDPTWRGILESASLEVFEMMAGASLTINTDPSAKPEGEQTAMVGLAGTLCGMVTIQCSSITASKLASLLLGTDAGTNRSMITDAMGELGNMVAGNFKAKLSPLSDHWMMSIPTVIVGADYVMKTAEPHEGVQFSLVYEESLIWITMIIQP